MSIETMYGHKRDDDAIEDDKNDLINLKREWIDLMYRIAIKSNCDDKEGYFVCAEEQVNDMLYKKWEMLCAEDGVSDDLPQSTHMIKWLLESRKRGKQS